MENPFRSMHVFGLWIHNIQIGRWLQKLLLLLLLPVYLPLSYSTSLSTFYCFVRQHQLDWCSRCSLSSYISNAGGHCTTEWLSKHRQYGSMGYQQLLHSLHFASRAYNMGHKTPLTCCAILDVWLRRLFAVNKM